MTKLTEQLREACALINHESSRDEVMNALSKLTVLLPALLTEHEKLEREAEAGKTLAKRLQDISQHGAVKSLIATTAVTTPTGIEAALITYHSACEK